MYLICIIIVSSIKLLIVIYIQNTHYMIFHSDSYKCGQGHGGKGGVASKNNKSATKDKPNLKSTTSYQTHRPNLSKSFSFPAKSAGGEGVKKSTNGTLAKTETKHANGAKAEASIRRSSRLTNSEVNSKEAETNTGFTICCCHCNNFSVALEIFFKKG